MQDIIEYWIVSDAFNLVYKEFPAQWKVVMLKGGCIHEFLGCTQITGVGFVAETDECFFMSGIIAHNGEELKISSKKIFQVSKKLLKFIKR